MNNNSQVIFDKYKNVILGRYSAGKIIDYFFDDFINIDTLTDFIGVVESSEADFTKKGLEFLEEYYGMENVARTLYKKNPTFPGKSVEENIQFFKNLTPPDDWLT